MQSDINKMQNSIRQAKYQFESCNTTSYPIYRKEIKQCFESNKNVWSGFHLYDLELLKI